MLQRTGDGYTVSHIAVDRGDEESLAYYLIHNADPEVRNYASQTTQQLAYLRGRRDMEELCREFGASRDQMAYLSNEDVVDENRRRSVMEGLKKVYGLQGNTFCSKRAHGSRYESTIAGRVTKRRQRVRLSPSGGQVVMLAPLT